MMNEDQELEVQSIEDKSQNYNKLKTIFTEDSLQFHQAEVSFKTHKEFVGLYAVTGITTIILQTKV